MNKVLAIDTEYNSRREILSLGLFSEKSSSETFFRNKVDKKSFSFHGIPLFFSNEQQSFKDFNLNLILDYEFILGFDIYRDLEVLNIASIEKLYTDKRIIDLKLIFNACGFNGSLHDLSSIFKISEIPHSSYSDAKSTYLIFFELFKEFENKMSILEFYELCSNLTKLTTVGPAWERDSLLFNFDFLMDKFKVLNLELKKEEKKDIIRINDNILVYLGESLLYRFPFKFLSEEISYTTKKIEDLEISFRFDKSILKKDLILYK